MLGNVVSLCRYYDVTYFIVVYNSASHRVLAISVRSNFTFASFICFQAEQIRNVIEALFVESDEVRI